MSAPWIVFTAILCFLPIVLAVWVIRKDPMRRSVREILLNLGGSTPRKKDSDGG